MLTSASQETDIQPRTKIELRDNRTDFGPGPYQYSLADFYEESLDDGLIRPIFGDVCRNTTTDVIHRGISPYIARATD